MDYERGSGQGFSSGLLEGPAIRDPAFVGPPVGYENDAPADRRAFGGSPLEEPPLGVRAPHRRTSFRAALNPNFASHHTRPPDFGQKVDAIALRDLLGVPREVTAQPLTSWGFPVR
jgi:hypothetical protein